MNAHIDRAEHSAVRTMFDLHELWRHVMSLRQDLVGPLDSANKKHFGSDDVAALQRIDDNLSAQERELVAEMLARPAEVPEDFVVLADLALTYDTDLPFHELEPAKRGECTHLWRLATALRKSAPHVRVWFEDQYMADEQRSRLLAA